MNTPSIHETNRLLARTINLGADFGAELERGWTVPVGPHHLDLCREAGKYCGPGKGVLGLCDLGLFHSPPPGTPNVCSRRKA